MNLAELFLATFSEQSAPPLTPWAWAAKHGTLVEEPSPGLFRLTNSGAGFCFALLVREGCYPPRLIAQVESAAAVCKLRSDPAAAALSASSLSDGIDAANLAAVNGWISREAARPDGERRDAIRALMRLLQLALEDHARRKAS